MRSPRKKTATLLPPPPTASSSPTRPHLPNTSRLDYTNPGRCLSFRRKTEGGHQLLQCRRETAVGGNDCLCGRQFACPVACGCMSCAIGNEFRRLGATALDREGAAGMEAAARGRIERARHL